MNKPFQRRKEMKRMKRVSVLLGTILSLFFFSVPVQAECPEPYRSDIQEYYKRIHSLENSKSLYTERLNNVRTTSREEARRVKKSLRKRIRKAEKQIKEYRKRIKRFRKKYC